MTVAHSLEHEADALGRVPLFRSIDPGKLKLLAFTSDRLVFKPGETLFGAGDPGDAAYVILSGTAGVYVGQGAGQREVARPGPHEIVGEIAILCQVPRTATVTAITELIVLRITKEMFFRLVGEFPEMALEIMRHLARRLGETTDRLR
jgi:CRP-like cAMP-binding protein